jgi:hypothetical protein
MTCGGLVKVVEDAEACIAFASDVSGILAAESAFDAFATSIGVPAAPELWEAKCRVEITDGGTCGRVRLSTENGGGARAPLTLGDELDDIARVGLEK